MTASWPDGPLPARHRWPVTLAAGPLRLRPLQRRDAAAWDEVRGRNWTWLRRWEPTSPSGPSGVLSFSQLVREFRRQGDEGRALPWVLDVADGRRRRLIGQVSVTGIAYGSARWGQLGYWIDEEFAGLGITPYCVAWAADYCLDVLGLHRIEVCIRPENAPSLRVVEKLGLPEEGLRRRYLHIDHDWRDHRVFVATREDFPRGLRNHAPRPRI